MSRNASTSCDATVVLLLLLLLQLPALPPPLPPCIGFAMVGFGQDFSSCTARTRLCHMASRRGTCARRGSPNDEEQAQEALGGRPTFAARADANTNGAVRAHPRAAAARANARVGNGQWVGLGIVLTLFYLPTVGNKISLPNLSLPSPYPCW